jgi:glutathione peroxidase
MQKPVGIALTLCCLLGVTNWAQAADTARTGGKTQSIHDFVVQDIQGQEIKLEQFRGKVVLLVNVASQCGYTPQYEGLQKVFLQYRDRGFLVLGFPANNFGGQEPGTNQEILSFCSSRFHVTFPMFSKISVKGEDKHPLYKYLTEPETNPKFAGEIKWNFNKFLVDRKGNIVARFDSPDTPQSEKVTKAIESALNIR